jgi:hypothetical protein
MNSPLISREILFGNPDKASPQLSPDGNQLGFLAPVEGVLNVWVGPATDPASASPVTNDTGRGIRFFVWAHTNQHILYIQDKGGDENWRIYSVNLQDGSVKDLTPSEGTQAQIQKISPYYPEEILIALNDTQPQFHNIYRLNIETGERNLIMQNDRFAEFLADDQLQLRFAYESTPDGGMHMLKADGGGGFEAYETIGSDDALSTYPIGFDRSRTSLYMSDSRGRDTAVLTLKHLGKRRARGAGGGRTRRFGACCHSPNRKTSPGSQL